MDEQEQDGGDACEVLGMAIIGEESRNLLDNLGITISLGGIPEYMEYRAERWRKRWLKWLPGWMFRRTRQGLDGLQARAQQAVMDSVIGAGTETHAVLVRAYPVSSLELEIDTTTGGEHAKDNDDRG